MKSILKRLSSISIMFAVLFCAGISFVGCKKNNQQVYGDFLYSVKYYDENGTQVDQGQSIYSGVVIQGLSDKGKKKEIIVVPEYINDLKVKELGSSLWFGGGVWRSEKLKKVFIPFSIFIYQGVFYNCSSLEKVILFANDTSAYNSDDTVHIKRKGVIPVFLTSYYKTEECKTNFFDNFNGRKFFYFSNVSYRYNYDNALNDGYYWIDDCDYGSKIDYIPEQPVRDGYSFGGWYKQSECIDAWDFDTDTIPQVQYTEDNEEIYQETKLYAKWIKK